LLALSIGGDDYICKPYSLGVLLAKVKAALKRYEESNAKEPQGQESDQADDHLVKLGKATVDLSKAVIIKDGEKIPLKAMEFRLLVYMLNNRNRIIKKEEFFEKIWGTEFVGDVTLNVHIRHLREKIEEDASNPAFIKTVWGTGFILEDQP
ncbi:MAG: response regulator transcription factor, partial [Clostridiales bacterium]|nr:response regulator transcription factor [Clostridiales bacterium]